MTSAPDPIHTEHRFVKLIEDIPTQHTLDVAECVFDTYQTSALDPDRDLCTVVATHEPSGTQATVTTEGGVGPEETRGQAFAKLEQLVEAL